MRWKLKGIACLQKSLRLPEESRDKKKRREKLADRSAGPSVGITGGWAGRQAGRKEGSAGSRTAAAKFTFTSLIVTARCLSSFRKKRSGWKSPGGGGQRRWG